eukprot:TRINITY_DN5534_c0_g1_i3.p1 TRINITY_DN5534_c0_g1~~TRINITY_DN5534_c0_g1_i3.p1  ORF type:complete len:218 (-),score=62.64 TRINITY_DN5534_c0_g1_i3:65-670(-)
MASQACDYTCKLVLVGTMGTGKSSLVRRLAKNTFVEDDNDDPMQEMNPVFKQVCGKTVKANIWDTCGQERFNDITSTYYRGAQAILLCYDCTNTETFEETKHWLREVHRYCPSGIAVLLVSCKNDLECKVPAEMANVFVETNELLGFVATSAKTNENVDKAFTMILENAVKELTSIVKPEENVKLKNSGGKEQRKKKKCLV